MRCPRCDLPECDPQRSEVDVLIRAVLAMEHDQCLEIRTGARGVQIDVVRRRRIKDPDGRTLRPGQTVAGH